uniref:Kindlin-2 N-terminal domain-containing protein n=1 Tax=Timema tahoe TaxID=61484 RepID=A0A7R9NWG5_9NEOP|nr:unnamed protein product [Timema tahoe]
MYPHLREGRYYNRALANYCLLVADIAMDWSDHALWWPARNVWLTRTRFTLDQYGVQADALLHFTPMHKTLRVQLPDLRYLDCRVDFSLKTFNAVVNLSKELGGGFPKCAPRMLGEIHLFGARERGGVGWHDERRGRNAGLVEWCQCCKVFLGNWSPVVSRQQGQVLRNCLYVCETLVVVAGVRYPEELSLCKPLEPNHLKYNLKDLPGNKKRQQQHQNHGGRGGPNNGVSPPDTNTFIPNHSPSGSTGSLEQSPQPFMCAPVTPTRHQTSTPISSPVGSGTWKKNNQSYGEMNGSYSPYNVNNSLTLEMLNGSLDSSLANSPSQPSPEARNKLLRPRTLVERARINVA